MRGNWNWLQKLGFLLVLLSCLGLLGTQLLAKRNQTVARDLANRIASMLPPASEGLPGEYSDPAMPVLQVDGVDFAGLIRVASFGITLPIADSWENGAVSACPRRFWGSVYDNSLILGGSSASGQFAFCGEMDLGDTIVITDMTGAEFSYEAARIDRRKEATMQTLQEEGYDLTLFVRDDASMNYIIVRCVFSP